MITFSKEATEKISVDSRQIVTFNAGLIGLPQLKVFALIEDEESLREMTRRMSAGWLVRSDSFGPPGALGLSSGKTGAATTYPACAQRCSSRA